jgi:MFS family permease
MFALLAIAGDIGSLAGLTAAGWIAERFGNDLRISFILAAIFPIIILIQMKSILLKGRYKA